MHLVKSSPSHLAPRSVSLRTRFVSSKPQLIPFFKTFLLDAARILYAALTMNRVPNPQNIFLPFFTLVNLHPFSPVVDNFFKRKGQGSLPKQVH